MKKFLVFIILFCISLLGCNKKHKQVDDDYYLGIKNICISVYIGSNQTPIEQIEIESEDFLV